MVSNGKVAKAYKAMTEFGFSRETVKPVLKDLLKVYHNSWNLLEDDNYKVLLDAILESEYQRVQGDKMEQQPNSSEDDPEESTPLLKRLKVNRQENSFEVVYDCEPLDRADPPRLLTCGSPEAKFSNAKENHEMFPEVINLDGEDIHPPFGGTSSTICDTAELPEVIFLDADAISLPLSKDASSRGNSSTLEGDHLKSMETEKPVANDAQELVKIDIASSSGGGVKLHLLFKSSLTQDFHVPNLDEVLELVEKKCRIKYKIPEESGFSVKKLLTELCELLLAKGATPTVAENLRGSRSYIKDITKGQENHEISLINEVNEEPLPSFGYIPKNVIFHSAFVKFQLARISDENCCSKCSGDCLTLDIPCACSGETRGEFAYTKLGLLKEKFIDECISLNQSIEKRNLYYCEDCPLERVSGGMSSGPCKGHVVRKFIKECWYKCGCNFMCGNRVVQRGIKVKLQVFMTSGKKGWGVRILEDVPKGTFICEYVGEVVTNTELYWRNTKNSSERHTYPVLLDADWSSEGILKDEEANCLDATVFGNVARFINHRCFDANVVEIPVEIETPDHHYYHLAFFTTRDVKANEELSWDYGINFADHTHPVKAFKCNCDSKFCRDRNMPARRGRARV